MNLQGTLNQQVQTPLYRADAVMTGSAQLVLAASKSRSSLILQNNGVNPMYVEIGSARAHCSLTDGVVTSVTIDNGGFNFTRPPFVIFLGGGPAPSGYGGINTGYVGLAQPNGAAPSRVAKGVATLSGGSVNGVTINDGGKGYLLPPLVFLYNDDLDPAGCATPSSGSGLTLPPQMVVPIAWNGTTCPTDSISVIGTEGDYLFCGYTI